MPTPPDRNTSARRSHPAALAGTRRAPKTERTPAFLDVRGPRGAALRLIWHHVPRVQGMVDGLFRSCPRSNVGLGYAPRRRSAKVFCELGSYKMERARPPRSIVCSGE